MPAVGLRHQYRTAIRGNIRARCVGNGETGRAVRSCHAVHPIVGIVSESSRVAGHIRNINQIAVCVVTKICAAAKGISDLADQIRAVYVG